MHLWYETGSRRLQRLVSRITVPAFHRVFGRTTTMAFQRLYYDSRVWNHTYWLGVPVQKCPLDLWMYQEILFEIKPDLIIETGSAYGGSALFLASMCDTLGGGQVMSLDIAPNPERPTHPRITYLTGSSTTREIFAQVQSRLTPATKVLAILDSDHTKKHVLAEMELYAPLVTPGSYLIVEDTNLNGHPVYLNFGDGPFEAVQEFLKTHPSFAIDKTKEKYLMTQNPGGYLKRLH